jgi:hypothetical protein
MLLTLIISLLAGQTVYEWIDAKGQSHFTNDLSSIPAGAKRRVTAGEGLTVTPAGPAASGSTGDRPDGGISPPPPPTATVDTCALAQKQLAQLEQRLEQAKAAAAQTQDQENRNCQQVLLTHGHGSYAQCMAGRTEPAAADQLAQKQLETSRETLRRAQQNGCR